MQPLFLIEGVESALKVLGFRLSPPSLCKTAYADRAFLQPYKDGSAEEICDGSKENGLKNFTTFTG